METIRKNPFTDIIDKVSFVNYLPLLTRATADNDEPTPGYLLQEIENITLQPDPCCQQLVDYLAQRLDRPSTPVKIKVLKIMNHLIQNGPRSFRLYLRRKDSSIKMAMSFQTAPDPLTGMSGVEAVRKLSQEVLGRLFDPQLLAEDSRAVGRTNTSRPGPGPALGGLGSSGTLKGRYEGFGNSTVTKKGSLVDTIHAAMDKWASSYNSTDRFIEEALKSDPGDYKPALLNPISSAPALKPELLASKVLEKETVHIPGRAGGGWDEPTALYTPVPPVEEPQEPEIPVGSTEPAGERSLEASLVTSFCTSGPLPCRLADIKATGQRCLDLNTEDVLQAISNVMSDELSDLCSPILVQLAEEGSDHPKEVRFKAEKLLLTMHRLQLINAQDLGPLVLP